jgi:DNA-binding NtrC family response regulator
VVARAIHKANPNSPFVPIDCGSLVGPLMESELFGHTKGAFTGAGEAKKGLIEMADGGTAFFDELGDLPLDMQVKLLRLLEEHEFRPVGSVKQHKIHIRVIAATHHDLAVDVQNGAFRLDLYYRLNVIKLHLPPVRERKEDIPLLIDHLLARYGNHHVLTREALDALLAYDWPGNVRELQNSIQRMVALNSGPLLHLADLPSPVQDNWYGNKTKVLSLAVAASQGPRQPSGPLMQNPGPVLSLTETEKRAIMNALEYTKGDRGMAAHLLGIGRTTLYRKLKEYRLPN